ncbi:ATP-binding protein [Niabella sp. CJ426]|uniref:ATP-binding protein n=1 Tax=Niabella sp. CJ426 TaxID=3393740 RepID=UPI003D0065B0
MSKEILSNGLYKIRPAARIIHTIGSDLIGDAYAALIELVKNSYDADSTKVDIVFEYKKIDTENALVITIKDDGHGMSFDTLINKWLVPATNDKLERKKSPGRKRAFQGRKGIGRFAASVLGQEMTLSSVDSTGEKSIAVIDWRVFDSNTFLDNVELLVEKENTNEAPGTTLQIIAKNEGENNKISTWDVVSINNLFQELRKLISPFEEFDKDKFDINLSFINCPFEQFNNQEFKIETYPIIKFYDYRISGTISESGEANLLFENNINPEAKQSERIHAKYQLERNGRYCGPIKIDYRVYDREPEAIDNLINKGLINPVNEKFMGKREAKRLLDEVYGVNIYKNAFRIRPYGNGGVDWLDLDKDRIQNFTLRISNNQIVGFIFIESEELSHLEEKSARDGLKENEYYFGLKELAKKALAELETRRLAYRVKSEKSRNNATSFQTTINDLFSLQDVKNTIDSKLNQLNVTKDAIKEINEILDKEEVKKATLKDEIEKTIAIYQGQATLGKIVNLILHEGRKPIQFFNSETGVIERYIKHYKATKDEEILPELNKSIEGFRTNSKIISGLFRRINPLASQKRGNRENFSILPILNDSVRIFTSSLNDMGADVIIECEKGINLYGWSEDLYTLLTNLLENSVYWLSISNKMQKQVQILVSENSETVVIDYKDNGPGLSNLEIESEVIFEPGYSKKLYGTGLGLAIAGEAASRLNGKLIARKYSDGAYFQIEFNK